MARVESDREDMLGEATAYPRRVEFRIPDCSDVCFAGLRSTGTSLYVGGDPVYHLDAEDRLRRAFVDGDLYRTQGTTFARLRRERIAAETNLLRHDLDVGELSAFLATAHSVLAGIAGAVRDGTATVLRSVPEEDDHVLADVSERFRRHLELGQPLAPAIKGKR